MSERKLKLARNPDLIDKNDAGNPNLFVAGWENREETVAEFLEATTVRGEAYTAQLSGSRKTANFLASNVASVDVDHGLSIKQARAPALHVGAALVAVEPVPSCVPPA